MSFGATDDSVIHMWQCGKCGTAQNEGEPFCLQCAATEGAPNAEAAPTDKVGKLTEAMMGAINWSLQNAQLKPAEVLAQAAKRGLAVANIADLSSQPLAQLDQLAGSFTNINRASATGTGFAAGLPGGLAGFVAIPADVSAVIYFSLRCLSGISQSYSFEIESEAGRAVELLAFAHACRLETFVIGSRRLENLPLARFLLENPEPYGGLVRACLLKQLASFLAMDFAKTSWATFLPVVGGFVNGTNNFFFLGDISTRGKLFYHSLLDHLRPNASPGLAATSPTPAITIEIRELTLALPGGPLKALLVQPEQPASRRLLLVLGEDEFSREMAERLAEKGYSSLAVADLPLHKTPAPDETSHLAGPATSLKELLHYVNEKMTQDLEGVAAGQPGLIGFGTGAKAILDLLADGLDNISTVVVYNPSGKSQLVSTDVPTLLLWSEEAAEVDPGWPRQLRPRTSKGLIAVTGYSKVGFGFANPASPDYHRPTAQAAWLEILAWLNGPA